LAAENLKNLGMGQLS